MIIKPVTIPHQRIEELQNHLMLFYTGIVRNASDVAKTYIENIDAQKKQLNIMKRMVEEALAVLDSNQNINRFGELLHEAWEAKRTMSTSVSNPFIDELYKRALLNGAVGGKLIGAGGGGFLLLFVPPSHQERIKKEFNNLIHVPFKFEHLGSQIIFFDPQEDYSNKYERS